MMEKRKLGIVLLFVVLTSILWIGNSQYPHIYLKRGFRTLFVLTIIYFIFKCVFEEIVSRRIEDAKTQYTFKKTISILYVAFVLLAVVRIWVEETQTLLVTYGLVATGIAISLQDFFKNFAGGIIIFSTGIYRIGDRIEVDSTYGDVIDISILYTTLLEMKKGGGDQATGGLTIVPNGYVLSKMIDNYTKDNSFVWDEIEIPLTYESNKEKAITKILDIAKKETVDMSEKAKRELLDLKSKYYLAEKDVEPTVYTTMGEEQVTIVLRYITDIKERGSVRSKLTQLIFEEIHRSKDLSLAVPPETIQKK